VDLGNYDVGYYSFTFGFTVVRVGYETKDIFIKIYNNLLTLSDDAGDDGGNEGITTKK